MSWKKLSVIVPVYNEANTLTQQLQKILDVTLIGNLDMQIIVVDDASTDGSIDQVFAFKKLHPDAEIRIEIHPKNKGKGAAIHTGIAAASGDLIVMQDADLEYDPEEFNDLLAPVLDGYADVVYGSRFMGGKPHRILFFWHSLGNAFLTFLSNALTNLNLTDMETCYKLCRADYLKSLQLKEKRFGFEPEVTAKLSRIPAIRFYEIGISYYGRTYEEGKKIGWQDGVKAMYCILKYNLWDR